VQPAFRLLREGQVDYEFRTTVVPSLIGEEEIYNLAREIRGPEIYAAELQPPDPLDASLKKVAPWDDEKLRRVQNRVNEILRS